VSERQTPETDSLWYRDPGGVEVVKRKHAARFERQRDELAEALRETTKKLSEIAADFNMTRMIMNDDEARKLAGEIVTEARARCNQSTDLLARLDAEKS